MMTLRALSGALPESDCQTSAALISALPDTSANIPASSASSISMGNSRLGRACAKNHSFRLKMDCLVNETGIVVDRHHHLDSLSQLCKMREQL